MYVTALGFIFLYVLERYFSVHRVCEDGVCQNVRHPRGGLLGAAELSAHSFVDGFAIGLGFQAGAHVGIIITVAVISHDFADGINTVTVMMNSGNPVRSSLRMLLLDAIAPVLGAASTLLFTVPEQTLIYILPFFAGGFLYLGASDLLPEAHESNPPAVSLVLSLAGFLLIFVVTRLSERLSSNDEYPSVCDSLAPCEAQMTETTTIPISTGAGQLRSCLLPWAARPTALAQRRPACA